MNDRKLNNYSIIRIGSVLGLTIALVLATFTVPLGTRTSANPIINNPPNKPSNPGPANKSTDISILMSLNWTGGDPDGNPVTYDVYFGTTSNPSKKVTNQSALVYNPGTINYTTLYYWKIVAWDNQSASTQGPLWHFTTKPNSPPNKPNNPYPTNNSTSIPASANLNWTGGDPYNDKVTYDVYFGTTSNPSKKVTNQSALIYTPGPMNYTTLYYWKIVAWDNHSASTQGPLWHFTTKSNSPPNTPSNPSPTNGATNALPNALLSWTGGDPDGNPVKYDVYFGATSSPLKVTGNQSTLSYTPGTLSYNTIYYWKIVAWDNYNASTKGPLWSFTTKALPTVNITKPLEKTLYFHDQPIMNLPTNTIIFGPINITASATSGVGIARVEFYIDGTLESTDTAAPYIYLWNPPNSTSLKHTIKVIAYDSQGTSASDELNVIKMQFNALPLIIAGVVIVGVGVAIASRLIVHTTVRGLIFNFKQSILGVSFNAIHIHYKTVGPFRLAKGAINFQKCKGGKLIGPIKMIQIGSLHKFAYATFTFLGDINYGSGGLGLGTLGNLLSNRSTKSVSSSS